MRPIVNRAAQWLVGRKVAIDEHRNDRADAIPHQTEPDKSVGVSEATPFILLRRRRHIEPLLHDGGRKVFGQVRHRGISLHEAIMPRPKCGQMRGMGGFNGRRNIAEVRAGKDRERWNAFLVEELC